jgi:ABC-2 type transport system permease protein
MLRGLWKLTILEIKIFLREPLGVVGSVGMPVVFFLVVARLGGSRSTPSPDAPAAMIAMLPVLGALLIAVGAGQSLVAVISIYREGGILKRLRATPLLPVTILSAHVVVKLMLTAVSLVLMIAAGRRLIPSGSSVPVLDFALALVLVTISVLSLGFIFASVIPTARFAQPVASLVFYPLMALALAPIAALPPALQIVTRLTPFFYGASLLRGLLAGEGWFAHASDVLGLLVVWAVCTAISSRVFRWE